MNRRVHIWAWVGSCLALAGPVAAQPAVPGAPPPDAPRPAEAQPPSAPGAPSVPAPPAPAESVPPPAAPATPAPAAETPAAPAVTAPTEEVGSGSGLFEASQSASAADSQTAAAEGRPALPFDLNGYLRGDLFVGKAVDSSKALMQAAYGEFALKLRTEKQSYGDAFAELRLKYGLEGDR